jgi:hypothetical protein
MFLKLNDWNVAKEKVLPRFLGKNSENTLADRPYRKVFDKNGDYICVCYVIDASDRFLAEDDTVSFAAISNKLVKEWNITEEILYETALNNLKKGKLIRPLFQDVYKALQRLDPGAGLQTFQKTGSKNGFYILTTNQKMYGAVVLLDNDLLKEIHKILGDFYVIPSSVHEVIITSKNNPDATLDEIVPLIKEVNDTDMVPEDILSYALRVFDGNKLS